MIQLALSLIALAAACTGLLASVNAIIQKLRAQRECVRLLTARAGALYIPPDELREDCWSFEELARVVSSIDRATTALSPAHRRLIAEGLYQWSALGRARYAAKLLKAAGIRTDTSGWAIR